MCLVCTALMHRGLRPGNTMTWARPGLTVHYVGQYCQSDKSRWIHRIPQIINHLSKIAPSRNMPFYGHDEFVVQTFLGMSLSSFPTINDAIENAIVTFFLLSNQTFEDVYKWGAK